MSNNLTTIVKSRSQLNALRIYDLCYLATPYSKFPDGMHEAYIAAAMIAGQLVGEDVKLFCPIAHSHVLCEFSGLDPTSHAIWNAQNAPFMRACDALIVAQLPSWESSVGVAHEIKTFRDAGKPIYFLPVLYENDRS